MKLCKATAALLVTAAIVIGPPMLLVQAGWPFPDDLPGLDELWAIVTRPPSDRLVLNVIVVLGWVLWAALVRAFAAELWARARNTRRSGSPLDTSARGPLRWVAAALIAAVVSAGPATAALPADAEPIAVTAPADSPAEAVAPLPEEDPAHPQQGDTGQVIHVVERGDTLWNIAGDEEHFDDPQRYPEIFEANEGVTQDDGRALEDEDLIHPGWELTIPITEGATGEEDSPPTSQEDQIEPDPTTAAPADPTGEPSESPSEITSSAPDAPGPSDSEDSAAASPPTAEPDEASSANAESWVNGPGESEPYTSATSDTAADSQSFQTGIWLTAGTFLGLGVAFSLLVLLRRRRNQDQEHDADDGHTLTGRLADLETLFDDEATDSPPTDTVLPLATSKGHGADAEVSLLDWAGDGLGLRGPGALAVVRAALISAAASQVPVVITASAAEAIKLDPAATPAWLQVVPALDAALSLAEERIEDPVFDLNAGRIDLPPLLLIADNPQDRPRKLAEVLKHDLIGALLLGGWKNAELTVAADGTVTDRRPADAGLERIEHCYIADPRTLSETIEVTEEPTTEPPAPIPDEEASPPAPEPENKDKATEPTLTTNTPPSGEQPRLILLGTPALLWNGTPVQWRRRRSLLLLAALATAPEGRSLDDLLETVVGDSHVDKARGHLGTVTSDTRRDVRDTTGLDIRAVLHDDQTDRYRLHPDITADLADFRRERHLAAASTTDTERRDHLARALSCYGGDFATGLDDDWLEPTRTELRAAAYTTCLHLAALHQGADDNAAAIGVLERATAIDRTRPDAWTALTEARIATGDEIGAQKARRGQRLWAGTGHNTTPM